jgi:hypothetical protein
MNFGKLVLLAVVGMIVLVAMVGLIAHFLSSEAKLERRRRRNNSRLISKSRRPTVKLSVRTKKR